MNETEQPKTAVQVLEAWAGSVRRLIAAAPIVAICNETGLPVTGHSTPEERQVIRKAALRVVDQWLERDLAALRDADRLREALRAAERLDVLAEAAHDAWYAEKARRLAAMGLSTWPSETGEEQLVPWADLSEPVREFDRIVVRAIASAALSEPVPADSEAGR